MRRLVPIVVLALVMVAFYAGHELRDRLAFDISMGSVEEVQSSLQAIRGWVLHLGWIAPLSFVGLVTFRYFLFLPSALVLTVGGLAFGALAGTLLGVAGIILSAGVQFGIGRFAGRELLEALLGERFRALEVRAEKIGLWLVAIGTAHPAGSMGVFHGGAGLTSISPLAFVLVVAVAAPIRAGAYAFLGSSIVDMDWRASLLIAAGLTLVALLPLLHPGLRARLLGRSSSALSSPG